MNILLHLYELIWQGRSLRQGASKIGDTGRGSPAAGIFLQEGFQKPEPCSGENPAPKEQTPC